MITQSDIKKLEEVFVTKEDMNEKVISKLDTIIGELQAMREEMTMFGYRQANHSDRIEKFKVNVFGTSFA